MLSPDTMQALRAVREQLATKKTALEQAIAGIDLVLDDGASPTAQATVTFTPPAKGNGKPLRKVKLPILARAAEGPSARPFIMQVLKAAASGLSSIEIKNRIAKAGGPNSEKVQQGLGSMKQNGFAKLSDDGIWTLTASGQAWKQRGTE